MRDEVKKVVINNLKRGAKFHYKIIIDVFGDMFYYSYRQGMSDCFKYYNK